MGSSFDKESNGRGAVITGGANGIGLAAATRCLELGMKVVIADINQSALDAAVQQLLNNAGDGNAAVIGVCCDVTSEKNYEKLRDRTINFIGGIKNLAFVFLNAGLVVGERGYDTCWKTSEKDFRKIVDTSMYGVYYGLRVFMPLLLQQDRPGALVSTASIAGLIPPHRMAAVSYYIAKHAVVLLMECASGVIRTAGVPITCHVLCPFLTETNIFQSWKQNTLNQLQDKSSILQQERAWDLRGRAMKKQSVPPKICISRLENGIRRKIFYVITPDQKNDIEGVVAMMRMKADDVLRGVSAPCIQRRGDFKNERNRHLEQAKKELQKTEIWQNIWPAKL